MNRQIESDELLDALNRRQNYCTLEIGLDNDPYDNTTRTKNITCWRSRLRGLCDDVVLVEFRIPGEIV